MYSIYNKFENILDVIAYTAKAMKEVGYDSYLIDEYIHEVVSRDNYDIIELSLDHIDDCNSKLHENIKIHRFDEDLRDNYCSSSIFTDDLIDEDSEDDNVEDLCDGLNFNYYWDKENGELEAYEGFNCCKNHYWDSDCSRNDASLNELIGENDYWNY